MNVSFPVILLFWALSLSPVWLNIEGWQDFSYKTQILFFYSENNSNSLNRPLNTNLIVVQWLQFSFYLCIKPNPLISNLSMWWKWWSLRSHWRFALLNVVIRVCNLLIVSLSDFLHSCFAIKSLSDCFICLNELIKFLSQLFILMGDDSNVIIQRINFNL